MMTVTPSNDVIESGASVRLDCDTASTGAVVTYTFLRNGQDVFSDTDSSYTMDSVSTADSGVHTCTVEMNSVTSLPSDGHSITVVGKVHIIYFSAFIFAPTTCFLRNIKFVFRSIL